MEAKKQGELTELRFYLEATKRGYTVSKPFGDSASYDFVLDSGKSLYRVQVKSTSIRDTNGRANRYRINASWGNKKKIPYSANQIDLLVAYIIPTNTWYLIPIRKMRGCMILSLFPHRESSSEKYEQYCENWDL